MNRFRMTADLRLARDFSRIVDPQTGGRPLSGHRMIAAAEGLAREGFRRLMCETADEITGGNAADSTGAKDARAG